MAKAKELKCPECGDRLILKNSPRFGPFYGCVRWPDCDGTHSAHRDGTPMGIPANRETKQARRNAHNAFDSLRIELDWSKARGYEWLAKRMGMLPKKCHIGRFNKQQCQQVINVCEKARPKPVED